MTVGEKKKTERRNRVERERKDSYCAVKRKVLRLRLKESRDSDWQRDRGRVFQTEGAAKEKTREPTVVRLIRGILRRSGSRAERRVREGS